MGKFVSDFWFGSEKENIAYMNNSFSLIKMASFRRAVANFVTIVTKKNIPVIYNAEDKSFSTEKVVVLSANIPNAQIDASIGLALHEAVHIVREDWDWLKNFDSHIPESVYNRALSKAELELTRKKIEKRIHGFWNWVRDRSNDVWYYKQAPGYRGYYTALYRKYFYRPIIDVALRSSKFRIPSWIGYNFRIINLHNKHRDLDALPGLRKIWEIIDLKNIDRIETSQDAFEVALKMWNIVIENLINPPKVKRPKAGNSIQAMTQDELDELPEDILKQLMEQTGFDGDNENSEDGQSLPLPDDNEYEDDNDDEEKGDDNSEWENDNDLFNIGDNEEETDSNGKSNDGDTKSQDNDENGSDGQNSDDKEDLNGDDNEEDKENSDDSKDEELEPEDFDDNETFSSGEDEEPEDFVVLTEKEENLLEKAIQKQENFLEKGIEKSQLTKKQDRTLKQMEKSGASIEDTGKEFGTIKTVVIRRLNEKMLKDLPIGNNRSVDISEEAVIDGIRFGKVLANKLQIRNETNVTVYTRKQQGKLDRRLVHAVGYSDSVCKQTFYDEYGNAIIHISIDASSSMASEDKWKMTMAMAVAIAKATDLIDKLDVIISFRTTIESNNKTLVFPLVVIAYDSRFDNFIKIRKIFPKLFPNGWTPEGLAYEAIMKEIIQSVTGKEGYFINFSDGQPYCPSFEETATVFSYSYYNASYYGNRACKHTAKQVKMMINNGIKVLSFFIDSDYGSFESNFKTMYGKNSSFINIEQIMNVANEMNKKLLSK